MGEWVAIDATTDRRAHARRLARVHDRMATGALQLAEDPAPAILRPVIARSWARSLAAGVDPSGGSAVAGLARHGAPGPGIASADVERRRASHPLRDAVGLVRGLVEEAHTAGHVAYVADADGTLLWIEGAPDLVGELAGLGAAPGVSCAEAEFGTNAIGTALAEGRGLQIFAGEHLTASAHGWACSGVPVHDPLTGQILGALSLGGPFAAAHPHTLLLLALAARAIEQQLVADAHHEAAQILQMPVATVSVLGRRRGSLRIANRLVELSRRHTEMLLLLWLCPEGLSAEQLALELYGEYGRPGSVRTEMHRLRAHLGPILGERPYRLLARIDCDVADIESRIAGGDVAGALARYPGSVLVDSDVPRLVELRDRLDDEVRAAVLASGDPALLERWLALPAGRDDLEVSRRLMMLLPREDPRRAAERPRLRRLSVGEGGPSAP